VAIAAGWLLVLVAVFSSPISYWILRTFCPERLYLGVCEVHIYARHRLQAIESDDERGRLVVRAFEVDLGSGRVIFIRRVNEEWVLSTSYSGVSIVLPKGQSAIRSADWLETGDKKISLLDER
jgi:hypothetical protein